LKLIQEYWTEEDTEEMADPGKGALVSPARDPERLAENLTALLTQKALRDRFSAHNRRRVKDFSVEEMVKANLAVYRELV
jgi:glycosyltransferase involved in cell wall biosynthesis